MLRKQLHRNFFWKEWGLLKELRFWKKKMNEKQKKYMITTLSRLLNKSSMGELFKVIFAYKSNNKKFFGFE